MQDSRYITMKKWLFAVIEVILVAACIAGGLIWGTTMQKSKDEDRWTYILASNDDDSTVGMCAECGFTAFTEDEAMHHCFQTQHQWKGNGRYLGKDGEWHDVEDR